jgi:CRISPR-associated protein Cmr5
MDMPDANIAQEPPRTPPLALARARHALAAVSALEERPPTGGIGNYVNYVKALPANILRSGLGQAMAMEKAQSKGDGQEARGHAWVYRHMQEWLLKGWASTPYARFRDDTIGADPKDDPPKLLKAIVNGSQADYVRAQAEALAYLEWLKKFAVAFLEKPDSEATDPAAAQGRGEEQ